MGTVTNINQLQLAAGRFYSTAGGDLVFIQRVEGRTAHGIFVYGQTSSQWHVDGRDVISNEDQASENDINTEVNKDGNRRTCRYCKRDIPRRSHCSEFNVVENY